ncbi:photosystem II 5 kDa protein, chloroplastic-like [Chenopodium quinoa]|uniref:photosystem II 5 kDa protein, chloroplastic-like n=1 Tax=Chenopodium quinoa TaxID=63459 RepID=UPI000B76E162|nr:photosystem II 5 kDa protein, chloroplastic-like [Chenopodium quinoa]
MASITMTASFLGTNTMSKQSSTHARRGVVMAKAMRGSENCNTTKEDTNSKRRDLVFAAAAAAACSIAKIAMAEEEPKRGTPEAKKKYAPICVTMPTAKICYK